MNSHELLRVTEIRCIEGGNHELRLAFIRLPQFDSDARHTVNVDQSR